MEENKYTWVNKELYPFESHFLDTDAGKLHYIDEGQGDPIVFLHGVADWSFSFRNQIKELSKQYRCIAYDHLGFGLSDKPPSWNHLPSSHAANFELLVNHLKLDNITLVLHDWGGPIGFSFAVHNPHKIKSLIVINSWTWPVNNEWYYQAFSGFMGGPIGKFAITQMNIFANAILPASFQNKSKLTSQVKTQLSAPFSNKRDRYPLTIFPGQIIKATPWLTNIWNKINVLHSKPILIVWGLKDIAYRPNELEVWKKTFPNAEVKTFSDVGHYPHEEYPQETSETIEQFLQKTK